MDSISMLLHDILITDLGWFYVLTMFGIVLVCIYIIFSPIGNTIIGGKDATPEHSTFSWITMLFSAGMGIGLVFWGVAEPVEHYSELQQFGSISSNDHVTPLVNSFVHWAIQPWALYAIMALIIAYFLFNKEKKGLLSETLGFKNTRVGYGLKHVIDILVIISTIFGVSTSLGLGSKQIGSGISFLNPAFENSFNLQVLIVIVISIIVIYSSISGLHRGMKTLSNLAILGSILLVLLMFVMGPTIKIIEVTIESVGVYLNNFITLSLDLGTSNPEKRIWIESWKIFYWAWWISWAPYVSTFIARISKGRSFKEFLIGVIGVPSLFAVIWFGVFGGTALAGSSDITLHIIDAIASNGPEYAFYSLFTLFPKITLILSCLGIIVISVFFITSANSATYVVAMFTEDGNINPSTRSKIIWGILIALVSLTLLFTGNLGIIQSVAVLTSLPVLIIILIMIINFFKELKNDRSK
ncbi:BCCT family transporter [Erysipelothrix aquatica]|uniref:BCCT family transporter n=2 Tax=Erysipelothrix aquatica TaxID=2683714 RepID=UPI002E2555F9